MNLKILSALFLITYQLTEGQGANEFLTVITPKEFYHGQPFKLFYEASVSSDVILAFKFGNSYKLRENLKNFPEELIFKDAGHGYRTNKTIPLSIVAVNNNQCSTLNVELSKRFARGYSFIQTDKPIYKPEDEVKIRLVVLDKNLRPHKAEKIVVEIIDSEENKFQAIQTNEEYNGLYLFKFPLTDNAILGDWKITAKVDNRTDLSASKYISVQKYVLPLFDITIDTNPTAYFTEAKFHLKVYAKYSFDKFAKGKTNLKFINAESQKVLYTDEIEDVKNIVSKEIDFVSHLNLEKSQCNFKLNISVEFFDEYSETTRIKTEQIQLFPEKKINLEVHARDKFEAGKPFHVDVLLKYSGGELVDGNDVVTLDFNCLTSSKHENHLINNKILKHGMASFDLQIPENVAKAKITAKYLHYTAIKDILADKILDESNGFFNIILPDERRKLGETFLVIAKSDREMNTVLFVIAGKSGMEEIKLKECHNQRECLVEFKITEDLLPVSNIYAYNFKKDGNVAQNSFKVEFEGLSQNYLRTTLKSSRLEPGKEVTFEINSKPKSTVGILAFDKSLTFLRKGNDIDKKEVLATFDENSENPMTILKNDFSDFKICTKEEKEIVEMARSTSIGLRFGFGDSEGENSNEENDEEYESDFELDEAESPFRAGEVRKKFPETWIFETFEIPIGEESVIKEFKLPDSITTWLISGFALNADFGFALAEPQELVTTQEFFMKISLPYSLKFGEILKLDIVTFNYVKTGSDLKVKLKLFKGDFQVLELIDPDQCDMFPITFSQDKFVENFIEVQINSGVTKSFYIKPTGPEKNLRIKVVAIATETKNQRKKYTDKIEKILNVIHEGATHYKGEMKTFEFSTKTTNTITGKLEFENVVENSVLIHGSITGNIVGPSLSVYEEFLALPDGCAAQLLAKFHKTTHLYRFLKSSPNPNKESLKKAQNLLIKGLQSMKNYAKVDGTYGLYKKNPTSTWITALSAQVFGDAINFFDNIVKSDKLITDALDHCAKKQDQNGFFEVSRFHSDIKYVKGIETEASFKVRHTAFILISFLKNPQFSQRYKSTIEKGFRYLDNKKNFADSFALGMASYCFALNGQQQKALNLLSQLNQFVSNDENGKFVNWSRNKKIELRFKIIITSYTALAYLKIGETSKARPFIDWLITQRNSQGDFSENFDTAIGTEAIVEMAKYPSQASMNVQVENAIGEKVVNYNITKENSLDPFYYEIPKHFSEYKIIASGTGKAVVGAFYEFTKSDNVLSDTFDLSVQPVKNDYDATIIACVNYKDQVNLNEAIIMEFALASGYVYDPHLNDFSGSEIVKNVELKKQKTVVQLHLEGITKETTCVEIKTQRSHVVAKTKKPFVKVYEYMNKDKFSAHFYSLEPLSCI